MVLLGFAGSFAPTVVLNAPSAGLGPTAASTPASTSPALSQFASALPVPASLRPFSATAAASDGHWKAVGRPIDGIPAVYETTMYLPDNPYIAGVAWIDTGLLHARLYSGSLSPGGLSWKYTAPISPADAKTLVAAFNGGFQMKDAQGGYMSEGKTVAPLRIGAASLVIYANGSATVAKWGRDATLTKSVVAVRQNLTLLVDRGAAVAGLNPYDTTHWGYSLHQVVDAWRSGLGVTANGALVYVAGPMSIVDLAALLVRAGSVRAMVLDMNPSWTVFSSFRPAIATGEASPTNGTDLLAGMVQGPERFFSIAYNRDFVTMSAG